MPDYRSIGVLASFLGLCGLLLAEPIVCGEPPADPDATLSEADRRARQQIRDEQKRILDEYKDGIKKEVEKLNELKSTDITIDDKQLTVKEPGTPEEAIDRKAIRDVFEVTPDDFDILVHERWSLHKHDFKCDNPLIVNENLSQTSGRTWLAFSFSIANSLDKPKNISPTFSMVTNRGAIRRHSGGFIPTQLLTDSVLRQLESPVEMLGFMQKEGDKLVPRQHFQPGEIRHGACVFAVTDQEFFLFNEAQILVDGLNNSYKYATRLKRTLVLTFEREGAEFYPHRTGIKYKDKRWEWIWMWDQDMNITQDGIQDQKLKTPNERDKLLWGVKWELANSSGAAQTVGISEVRMVLPAKVEMDGTPVEFLMEVVDDGKSTIHKTAYMKAASLDHKTDRTFAGTVKPNEKAAGTAIFDGSDIDFDRAFEGIEAALTLKIDRDKEAKDNAEKVKPLNPEKKVTLPINLYRARRVLDDQERETVRTQLLAQVEPALQTLKTRKAIVLKFRAACGLASGEKTVNRSYRKPGKIEEDWLNEWEKLVE